MTLRVDPGLPTPPSRQIAEALLDRVAAGALAPGDRLPSVRGLAAEALVNPNTVGKAYRDLEALGVVEGRSGAGVFVTREGPAIARQERRGATLDGLRAALQTALNAGHAPEALTTRLSAWLDELHHTAPADGRGLTRDVSSDGGGLTRSVRTAALGGGR